MARRVGQHAHPSVSPSGTTVPLPIATELAFQFNTDVVGGGPLLLEEATSR